jgi:hypothetical protein
MLLCRRSAYPFRDLRRRPGFTVVCYAAGAQQRERQALHAPAGVMGCTIERQLGPLVSYFVGAASAPNRT